MVPASWLASSARLQPGIEERRGRELEWAVTALEEPLGLRAWVNMLRARHARELGYTCTG
ncbi:MAG: hypothetical protein J7L75_01875 [Thermoproteales archaeon]|nr:hypothetical protein [Thermoproteales archaeon]